MGVEADRGSDTLPHVPLLHLERPHIERHTDIFFGSRNVYCYASTISSLS
jgi:hypothetical protein